MKKYDYKKIEKKWQKIWEQEEPFKAEDRPSSRLRPAGQSKKEKFYCLIEFPYPSGAGLHVGHVRSQAALDVMARKARMEGKNVLYPIGWDAFGLPTENYAIKTGIHPIEATKQNVKIFKKQIKSLGISFDWSREINTTEPEYYKWTQWIFLQLYKHGLAYKKAMPINWCSSCKIGLANEEVVNGACERCGTKAERRHIKQWMLKITDEKYVDRLIEDLETVDYLPQIKTQQINWIGRSYGAEIKFEIQNSKLEIKVYTTRPDTIFGATYMVLAPEHELVETITTEAQRAAVHEYQEQARHKSDLERTELSKEKTGVFTGAYVINPATNKPIPIWIADYVLANYGTGAIMAVPAHDERDFEFAKKFELPIKEVIVKKFGEFKPEGDRRDAVAAVIKREDKVLVLYNKQFDVYRLPSGGYEKGETAEETIAREIVEETGYNDFQILDYLGMIESNNYIPEKKVQRQKFHKGFLVSLNSEAKTKTEFEEHEDYEERWYTEKEAIEKLASYGGGEEEFVKRTFNPQTKCFDGSIGTVVNSEFLDGLNVEEAIQAMNKWLEDKGIGKATKSYKLRDWIFSRQHYWGEPIPIVFCAKCGEVPVPEDQLPVKLPMVKKYEPTDTGESPLASIDSWVKVECPKCGGPARRETDTMPNWAGSSWYFMRYLDPKNDQEFASQEKLKYWLPVDLYNGGMEHTTLHLLYSRFWNKFLYDIGVVPVSEPYQKRVSHGMILAPDGEKMSKSRGNVINPDEVVAEYGADVLRTYEMFIGPYDQAVAWDTNGIKGVKRFLDKVWYFGEEVTRNKEVGAGNKELGTRNKELGTGELGKIGSELQKTIIKVTKDIDLMHFNTAVSTLMTFMNEVGESGCNKEMFRTFLVLLAPFAPHIAEEINERLGFDKRIWETSWPKVDAAKILVEKIVLPVMINGKVREKIEIEPDLDEAEIKKIVLKSDKVQKYLDGKEPKKIIFVKGKMLSIVV
ncbi:TPA: leucine--tRNA ligase [Candidatus Falkowbacteria bacterium]|nr:leucine--tRNA ligase [Candidatus Falkowbacteria bacterium]